MISLYRGELHKVSGVPRQWTVPKSQIPLSVFRNALKKRNVAVNKLLQSSSVQKTDANATPVANGTGEASGLASVDGSGELEKRGGSDNYDDSRPDGRAENGVVLSDGKPADSKEHTEAAEEEAERRQERKRRREEDHREETGRCTDRKEESARREGGELETTSRAKSTLLQEGSEPMVVDSMDQVMAMDCDAGALEKAVTGCDETMAERVRVRVTDVGMSSGQDSKQGNIELGNRDAREAKHKDIGNPRRNGELVQVEATDTAVPYFEETKPAQIQVPATADENDRGAGSSDVRMMNEQGKKKEELEAKLEKLRAEKHRFVLRLKQVLNEEEVKKRGSLASGSPVSLQGTAAGPHETTGMSAHGEKHGVGGSHISADLEDGELEYARTPSPPVRAISTIHGSLNSHSTLGPPPPMAPVVGRQTSLSQHLSQSATGSGGYYAPGLGIPPSPVAPGIAGGALSPGLGFMGNLPSPLSSHSYSHNLALQHAASIHAQKVTSVAHGHGQFSPIPPSGGPVGAGPGVAGGPPGFSGYAMSSSVHSHHSHLQPVSSSLPHIAGQQGVSSSSLLTTPRGPPGYHDMRLGGSTWIQR